MNILIDIQSKIALYGNKEHISTFNELFTDLGKNGVRQDTFNKSEPLKKLVEELRDEIRDNLNLTTIKDGVPFLNKQPNLVPKNSTKKANK